MDYTKDSFIWEDSEVYHSKSADNLSSHQLTDYIKSPIGYWYRRQKERVDLPAFALGRAVHQYVLEGADVFHTNYITGGPINDKTGLPYGKQTKKYADWLAEQESAGKQGISDDDYQIVKTCQEQISAHQIASGLLAEGWPEAVVRTDYCATRCQIRIDWFNPNSGLVDLKTCRNIERFEYDFRDFLYANQLAFYREVFNAHFGDRPKCWIIAAEVNEPYRVGVYQISDGTLGEAAKQNESFIPKYLESKRTGVYPTNYESLRVI